MSVQISSPHTEHSDFIGIGMKGKHDRDQEGLVQRHLTHHEVPQRRQHLPANQQQEVLLVDRQQLQIQHTLQQASAHKGIGEELATIAGLR